MDATDETIPHALPNADRTDGVIMDRIQRLAAEAHAVYGRGALEPGDQDRLRRIRLELDQCWDLLRQRLALREAGLDPAQAQVRCSEVVEGYKG